MFYISDDVIMLMVLFIHILNYLIWIKFHAQYVALSSWILMLKYCHINGSIRTAHIIKCVLKFNFIKLVCIHSTWFLCLLGVSILIKQMQNQVFRKSNTKSWRSMYTFLVNEGEILKDNIHFWQIRKNRNVLFCVCVFTHKTTIS